MVNTKEEIKALIAATVVISGVVCVGLATAYNLCSISKPKFKVGECIQLHQDLERWEENPYHVFRIEEIGVRKYRTLIFTFTGHLIPLEGLDFAHQDNYDVVPCPEEVNHE